MAIAGWLVIGVALLILVAVINNSWRPLLDQFRGGLSGMTGGGSPPDAQPADGAPPAAEPPSTEPTVPDPSTAPIPPNNQVVEPGQPPAVAA